MPKVEKVTISVPTELMAHIEGLRQEAGANRSEVVTDQRREERYRAAYQAEPETIGELEWADMAAAELLAGDTGEPDSIPER
jgi:metal-responsive CopG/Arc/MetJ family transcriptional regulator